MEDTRDSVGILDTHFALEPVGVPEEEAQHRAEVGDEVVGRPPLHEAFADGLEGLERGGLQGKVVEAAAAEHGRLAICLMVALYLEHVELGPVSDLDDRQPGPLALGELAAVPQDLGVEDLTIEVVQPVGVVGDHPDVVQTFEQHAGLLGSSGVTTVGRQRSARRAASGPGKGPGPWVQSRRVPVRRQRRVALLRTTSWRGPAPGRGIGSCSSPAPAATYATSPG